MLRQFEEHLTEKDWHEAQAGVEVKLVPGPEGDETFLLARSADRRQKEKAMHERFVARLEEALRKMRASAESGRLKDEGVANRRLGRLLGQYWRPGPSRSRSSASRRPEESNDCESPGIATCDGASGPR